MEEWRDIEGYEGLYQVSNEGRVKSLWNNKELILAPYSSSKGHLKNDLCKSGKREKCWVHILVAKAFLENPNPIIYTEVHHIDHNPNNNFVGNLTWLTRQEHIEEHRAKKVYQYTLDDELVNTWKSAAEAARVLGFNHGHIAECCRGERKTHKGYKWSYEETL